MQRLIQSEKIPSSLIGALASLVGHALLVGAVCFVGGGFGLVTSASAEDLLQPRPGTQARVTHADAEQARIATVFTTRSPSAEEALAWAHPDNQVLQVLLVPETPAPVVAASAN